MKTRSALTLLVLMAAACSAATSESAGQDEGGSDAGQRVEGGQGSQGGAHEGGAHEGGVDVGVAADTSPPAPDSGAGGHRPVSDASLERRVGPPGEWVDVTPSDISLDPDSPPTNYAVQDVVVDPARPSDLYAFVCYQGVWRSQDFGQSWTKVSEPGSDLETGRPWSAGIDSNPQRDPDAAPALYTFNGYGSKGGIFRSTDWGVHWTHFQLPDTPGQDAYSVNVDPYDGKHLLVGFHEGAGLIESTDGAESWRSIAVPPNSGVSIYAYFVDTAEAATTRNTWIIIAQANAQNNGTARSEDGGLHWTKVETLEHGHGTSQIYQPEPGTIFLPGVYGMEGNGIYRSQDFGKTWHVVNTTALTTVIGTPSYLYANASQGWDPGYALPMRAEAVPGTDWKSTSEPPGMTDGSKRLVVTYDGSHYIVVGGNWHAGIWRYVEP